MDSTLQKGAKTSPLPLSCFLVPNTRLVIGWLVSLRKAGWPPRSRQKEQRQTCSPQAEARASAATPSGLTTQESRWLLKSPTFQKRKLRPRSASGHTAGMGIWVSKLEQPLPPLLACFSRGLLRRRQSWTHALSLSEEVFEAIRFLSRLITDPCEISHAEPGSQQALDSSAHISLAEVSSEGSAGLRIPASLPLAGSSEHNSAHPTNE